MITFRPTLATPARQVSAEQMLKAVKGDAKEQGAGSALVSVASLITAPVGLYAVGKAAVGGGEAGNVVKVLAGVGAALTVYRGVKGLASRQTAENINNSLKEANGGRDLAPADAEFLAQRVNSRNSLNSTIAIANGVSTGVAIATGSLAGGLLAVAIKVGDIGYTLYSTAQTLKDFKEVLERQPAPAPPTPAPTQPAQPAAPQPAQQGTP